MGCRFVFALDSTYNYEIPVTVLSERDRGWEGETVTQTDEIPKIHRQKETQIDRKEEQDLTKRART